MDRTTRAAHEAVQRGYQVIPIRPKDKVPVGGGWTKQRWPKGTTEADVQEVWDTAGKNLDGQLNVGVLLGEPSGGLLDVDLDHPSTIRLKDYFLPPTSARSGRAGKPNSHYWYIAEEGTLPGIRQHTMPRDSNGKRGEMIVELRSTGSQTVMPPSIHPSGEDYHWSNQPWGGDAGPTVVNGRVLAVQVALLALTSVLKQSWPQAGSRHEAYLALAGGLLRFGDGQIHPYWERNAATIIRAIAEVTLDDDGADQRESESIHTTIKALKSGKPAIGFGKLAEILGDNVVDQVRVLIGEVESAAGFTSRQAPAVPSVDTSTDAAKAAADRLAQVQQQQSDRDAAVAQKDVSTRDPLEERMGSWEPVDVEPYLLGQVTPVMPSVLERDDGQHLMYPGRVNMLYGSSESAKSWLALYTCIQEMEKGQRAVYIDFEDEPVNTLSRLVLMGADKDDIRNLFTYIRPEEPLAPMQMNRWGQPAKSEVGDRNFAIFQAAIEKADPSLIVADGMTVLYGLHGLDTNDAASTDIITNWLKSLARNGRSTVILIDHTTKGAERGATPIGSQHKQAMVQGAMIQVWATKQPMPGELGTVELIVLKDRPGQVRKASVKSGNKAQLAAVVDIDSRVAGVTTVTIKVPGQMTMAPGQTQIDLSRSKKAEEAQKRADAQHADEEKVKYAFGGVLGRQMAFIEIAREIGAIPDSTQTVAGMDKKTQDRWKETMIRLIQQGWIAKHGRTKDVKYELIMGGGGYDRGLLDSDLNDDLGVAGGAPAGDGSTQSA